MGETRMSENPIGDGVALTSMSHPREGWLRSLWLRIRRPFGPRGIEHVEIEKSPIDDGPYRGLHFRERGV